MTTRVFVLSLLILLVGTMEGLCWAKSDTVPAADKKSLKPKEVQIDSNFDGSIDRTEVYDADGKLIRAEADSNADGKIDEWVELKNGVRTAAKRDMNGDGKPDVFLTYDDKGSLLKLESDTAGKGQIDEWVYYENGEPKKAEKDTNGDGKPDTWITY